MGFPLVQVLISVGASFVLGQLRPRVRKPKPQDLEGWVAEEGRVIPYLAGVAPVEGNVGWWGDRQIAGDDARPEYHANMVTVLCQGPIDQLLDIQAGGKSLLLEPMNREQSTSDTVTQHVVTVFGSPTVAGLPFPRPPVFADWTTDFVDFDVNARQLFGGRDREGGIEKRLRVYRGSPSQAVIDALTAHGWAEKGLTGLGGSAYPGVCYAAVGQELLPFYWGTVATPKPMVFILGRWPRALRDLNLIPEYTQHQVVKDANPAEIIYELSVDPRLGLGMNPADIDLVSLARAGARWQEEQFGQSVYTTQKEDAKGILDELLKAGNAIYTPHPVTGQMTLALLRPDYVVGSLLTITDNAGPACNCRELEEGQPLTAETHNEIQLNFRRFTGGIAGGTSVDEVLTTSLRFVHGFAWLRTKNPSISAVTLKANGVALTPGPPSGGGSWVVQDAKAGLIAIFDTAQTAPGQTITATYTSQLDAMRFEEAHINDQMLADQQITGDVRTLELEAPYTTDDLVAGQILARAKQQSTRPLRPYRWKMHRAGYALYPGAVCKITSSRLGLVDNVVRVSDVDQGTLEDPTITVLAVEDIWAEDVVPVLPPVGGGTPDPVKPTTPAMAIGCGIGGAGVSRIALFASDTNFSIEVWQANDALGAGAILVATVAGATAFYDGIVGKSYRARQVHPTGLTSAGAYTPWITCTAVNQPPVPPTCAPVTYLVQPNDVAGTVTLVLTDTQNRLRQVRFRHRSGGGDWSAWAIDSAAPYTDTVVLDPTFASRIEWEIDAQACDGSDVTLTGGYDFVAGSPPPPDPEPEPSGVVEIPVEIVLYGVEQARTMWSWPLAPTQLVPGSQDYWPLQFFKFARIVVVNAASSLVEAAYVKAEFEAAGAPDTWSDLAVAGGPSLGVGPLATGVNLTKARKGDWVPIRVEALQDVRIRGVGGGGDADPDKTLQGLRAVLQLTAQDVAGEEPQEPELPTEEPGSCTVAADLDPFAYANLAALNAAWPEG